MVTLTASIVVSDNDSSERIVKESGEISSDENTANQIDYSETSIEYASIKGLLDEMLVVNDKRISFDLTYKDAIEVLGEPDDIFGEGGKTYIAFGKVTLQFVEDFDETDNLSNDLARIIRDDIFSNRSEVESVLGSPSKEAYIEEVSANLLTYSSEEYTVNVWVNENDVVTSVNLMENSTTKISPEQTRPTMQTEEITTDLRDGNVVTIQFQLVTDTEAAKAELIEREFQFRNIVLKELAQRTVGQLESDELVLINIQESTNQLLNKGEVVEVSVINKIIR